MPSENVNLMIWTEAGEIVADTPIKPGTIAIANDDDSDVVVDALGDASAFLTSTDSGHSLCIQAQGGQVVQKVLQVGIPLKAGAFTWLLTQNSYKSGLQHDERLHEDPREYAGLVFELVRWMRSPMSSIRTLRTGLEDFLKITAENTAASTGMLVLAEPTGMSLVSVYGTSMEQASSIWAGMPKDLNQEILKENARIILPDNLKKVSSGLDSTVFVKGFRSMVGFPVVAEERLVAIFYLGFENLLSRFSEAMQFTLEAVADLLGIVVQRALLREQLEGLKGGHKEVDTLPNGRLMVGSSPKIVEVYKLITRLAPVDVPTLVHGETGTGKELVARELHRLSSRAPRPFIAVNAAALPEALIESELFGHKKGAFTGAISDRIGLIEQANEGTLFIDEVGELSLSMQAKLLRVLQEYSVTRIGETNSRSINFRLICATHRDLQSLMERGLFREDLYYRIGGAIIQVPALRERRDDILTLATYFRSEFASQHGLEDKEWSSQAKLCLQRADWPGNVRELQHVVSSAFVLADGNVIKAKDLGKLNGVPDESYKESRPLHVEPLQKARDEWMREFIVNALHVNHGKRSETAKALGIGERTLFRYIEQLGITDA